MQETVYTELSMHIVSAQVSLCAHVTEKLITLLELHCKAPVQTLRPPLGLQGASSRLCHRVYMQSYA